MRNLLLFLAFMAFNCDSQESFKPYGAVEFQTRQIALFDGKNVLCKNRIPAYNLILGFKFNENFSVEAGTHFAQSLRTQGEIKQFQSYGFHLSAIGRVKLKEMTLLGGLGFAHISSYYDAPTRLMDFKKIVPRMIVGMEFPITENLKARFSGVLENTDRMVKKYNHLHHGNSMHYNIGLNYCF